MRRRLLVSLTSAVMLALALASITYGAGSHHRVNLHDACDGPSFNAAIGPGTCLRNGGVQFDAFVGELIAMGHAPAWHYAPDETTLASGGSIDAYNDGGEFHTFTEVAAFGGGCIPFINNLLGLSAVPECAIPGIFATTGVAPGSELDGAPLSPGTHLFQCLIHPWMRTTVSVP